jgi:hypothetical protein
MSVSPIHCGLFRMSLASKFHSSPSPTFRQRIQERHRSFVTNMSVRLVTLLGLPPLTPRGVRNLDTQSCTTTIISISIPSVSTAIVSISIPSESMKCKRKGPHYFIGFTRRCMELLLRKRFETLSLMDVLFEASSRTAETRVHQRWQQAQRSQALFPSCEQKVFSSSS